MGQAAIIVTRKQPRIIIDTAISVLATCACITLLQKGVDTAFHSFSPPFPSHTLFFTGTYKAEQKALLVSLVAAKPAELHLGACVLEIKDLGQPHSTCTTIWHVSWHNFR